MRKLKNIKPWQVGVASLIMIFGSSAFAATNQATDPGGGGVSLSSSGVITINAAALAIIKEARGLNGNNLGATAIIPSGQKFYFVLYVDNTSSVDITDVRFIDLIDTAAFTVDTASFEILNTVAAPGIEMVAANDTAWTTSGTGPGTWNGLAWNTLTIANDGDQLDWSVSTSNQVTVGVGGGNSTLDIIKSTQADPTADPRRAAIRFQVTMN